MPEHVYFAQTVPDTLIKIGTTGDLDKRIVTLRSTYKEPGLSYLATFEGGREEENFLHRRFRHLLAPRQYYDLAGWHDSREWFLPEPDLCNYIEAVKQAGRLDIPPRVIYQTTVQTIYKTEVQIIYKEIEEFVKAELGLAPVITFRPPSPLYAALDKTARASCRGICLTTMLLAEEALIAKGLYSLEKGADHV